MLPIRLPSFPIPRHDFIVRLLTLDAQQSDGRVRVPKKTKPSQKEIADHIRRSERFIIHGLYKSNDQFNSHYKEMYNTNNASVFYAIETAAHKAQLTTMQTTTFCENLTVCGLSAGRAAFPDSFQSLVDQVGSHRGDLKEALFDVAGTDKMPYEPLRHNYMLYKMACLDRLAVRWAVHKDETRLGEYQSLADIIAEMPDRRIEIIPPSLRLPAPKRSSDPS